MGELVADQEFFVFQFGDFAFKGGDGFGVGGFDHPVNQCVLLLVERGKLTFEGGFDVLNLSGALRDGVLEHINRDGDHVLARRDPTQNGFKPAVDFFCADVFAVLWAVAGLAKEVRIILARLTARPT